MADAGLAQTITLIEEFRTSFSLISGLDVASDNSL